MKQCVNPRVHKIALLGNLPPRVCGIATYTADVASHIKGERPGIELQIVAMVDCEASRSSDPKVASIDMNDRVAYAAMAERLNSERYDILHVQHEFGIFGGEAGEYLLDLMRAVNMPIVTTLHTILLRPTDSQRRVLAEVVELSERVTVMTKKGVDILEKVYGICPSKVDFIHHGIPDANQILGAQIRRELGNPNPVILTFGLIGRDKGIHVMIEAMGEIVRTIPEATYVIVGATHPHLVAREGEAYRESLEARVKQLGLEKNVKFVNRFVSNEELAGWLAATDVYVTPYLKEEQITSGTLAYALGNGNAVVSTPYWHASELLGEDRGVLTPFGDAHGLASAIIEVLSDPCRRSELRERAALFGQSMRWPSVAAQTLKCYEKARWDCEDRLRDLLVPRSHPLVDFDLPQVNLDHLISMTDDTGLLQHATYRIPNRNEGYCTDDNARALIAMVMAGAPNSPNREINKLYRTYLAFVAHAFDPVLGRLRNFMGYDRQWLETVGSDDSNGRAAWALAVAAKADQGPNGELALRMTSRVCRSLTDSPHTRTWAFRALALHEIGHHDREFASRLHAQLRATASKDWFWFEDKLTYDNARLSQALILSGDDDPQMRDDGLRSLEWLMEVQTGEDGLFAPIGCNGFWPRGSERAWFDQQPIEAWASVSACLSAAKVTGKTRWLSEARRAFGWFLGENSVGMPVADPILGVCADGLQPQGVNMNCGAESTLAYLMALLELWAVAPPQAITPKETDETNAWWIPDSLRSTP